MKKNMLITIFLLITLFSCTNTNEKKQYVHYYVSAKSGLILREKPNTNSRLLQVIPYKTSLKIDNKNNQSSNCEEINNITGCWTEIKYKDKSGWVFGGFLSKIDPNIRESLLKKKCNYKDTYVEIETGVKAKILPFKKEIDIKIPCIICKENYPDISYYGDFREYYISKSGRWLVFTSGTSPYGSIGIYDLLKNKIILNDTYGDVKFISDESFEYDIAVHENDKCYFSQKRFIDGHATEFGKRNETDCKILSLNGG